MKVLRVDRIPADSFEEVGRKYGRKAAGLWAMHKLGLPVPFAWVSEIGNKRLNESNWAEVIEVVDGCFSVRSGAAQSMPGRMRTVLNVGLDAREVRRLEARGFSSSTIEMMRTHMLTELGLEPQAGMRISRFEQFQLAFHLVHGSWKGSKSSAYRRILSGEPEGTAVLVQEMKFGNLNDSSGSGVCFSRDPQTGDMKPVVDYVAHKQGTAAVEGKAIVSTLEDLIISNATAAARLTDVVAALDKMWDGPVDVEFTIEDGDLWLLQCRSAKMAILQAEYRWPSEAAEHNWAVNGRIEYELNSERPVAVDQELAGIVAVGKPASRGVGVGRLVLAGEIDPDELKRFPGKYILLADTADLTLVSVVGFAAGLVICSGGPLSHLALVARSLGVPCIVAIDERYWKLLRDRVGNPAVVDGRSGRIFGDESHFEHA